MGSGDVDREACFVDSTCERRIDALGRLRAQDVVRRGSQGRRRWTLPIKAESRKEWKAAKRRCSEKCRKIAQREQRVLIIVRRAKRIGGVGQITPERGETSVWTLEPRAFRSPSHCFIGEQRANCSTGEELSSDKDDVDIIIEKRAGLQFN